MGSPEVQIPPGTVLAGKYRVERTIGVGGMGIVVAATNLQTAQPVAVKLMRPTQMGNREQTERFIREARAAVSLKSAHVAHVLEVGTLPDGAPFMAMELLVGADLAHLIQERGSIAISHAVDYVMQACEALSEAHALGIVHRDLKPHNLFIARDANGNALLKILDFGISKVQPDASVPHAALTKTTSILGSPYYMSPEQMRSARDVDGRSDVWSLGVCLYEMLTGRLPFIGVTMMELGAQVLCAPPLPLMRPDLPPGLEAVLLRCLDKEPTRRFATATDLSRALAPFVSAPSPFVAPTPRAQPGPEASGAARTNVTWDSRSSTTAGGTTGGPTPRVAVAVALAGVLVAVVGAIAFTRMNRPATHVSAGDPSAEPSSAPPDADAAASLSAPDPLAPSPPPPQLAPPPDPPPPAAAPPSPPPPPAPAPPPTRRPHPHPHPHPHPDPLDHP